MSSPTGPPDKDAWLYLTGNDFDDLANIEAAQQKGWTIGPAVPRAGGKTAILLLGVYSTTQVK
jgi:hypothetical protein